MENTEIDRKELEPDELELAAGGRTELDKLCTVRCQDCGEIMQMKRQKMQMQANGAMETVIKVFLCDFCGKTCTITPEKKGLHYQW